MESITFPIRINRYLSLRGIATRRDADALIIKKLVLINGRIAILGDMVQKNDKVIVDTTKTDKKSFVYIAYHKPAGVTTPQRGEKNNKSRPFHGVLNPVERYDIDRAITLRQERRVIKGRDKDAMADKKLFPVGRLDKESSGLMILTNDGRITDRLLNPKYNHEKEYIIETDKKITPHVLRLLQKGVVIEGYRTKPSQAIYVNDNKFRIILSEGKKHQIRRMLAAVGMQVVSLKRVRIMNIALGNMKQGEMREIKGEELRMFLYTLGL